MTELARARAARSTRPRGGTFITLYAALAAFLAGLALLALRLGAGQDPALRARADGAVTAPRQVLVRRIIERRVIVHLPASVPAPATRATQQVGPVGGGGAWLPPITRAS